MGSALSKLKEANERSIVVRLPNGDDLHVKYRRVRAIDLIEIGSFELTGFTMAQHAREMQVVKQERELRLLDAQGDEDKIARLQAEFDEDDSRRAKALEEDLASDPSQAVEVLTRLATWAAAGVVAISDDGETWEPVKMVVEDPFDEEISVHLLGEHAIGNIAAAVLEFSTGGNRKAETFRE